MRFRFSFFFGSLRRRLCPFDGYGKRASCCHRLKNIFYISRGFRFAVIRFSDFDHRQQLFQQRSKFELGEKLAQRVECRFARAHRLNIKFDGNVGVDGRHALAEKNCLAIVLQRFTISFLLNFGGVFQRPLDRAEALDDLNRTFVADARRPGDIVDGITAQSHHVDHALRRHAKNFLNLGGIANQIIFGRVQDLNFVVDQLHHVFVARDDVDGVRSLCGFAGEGADQIVGFEAGEFENGDAIRFERAPDIGKLLRQILRHGRTIGFVTFVFHLGKSLRLDVELADGGDGLRLLVAKSRRRYVVNRRQVFGRKIVAQLAQHVDENVDGGGGQSVFGRHGPLARHGVVGAENKRHRVDEKDAAVRGRWPCGGRCDGIEFRRFPAGRQVASLAAGVFALQWWECRSAGESWFK